MMDSYKPIDVTQKALAIAKKYAVAQEARWATDAASAEAAVPASVGHDNFGEVSPRRPDGASLKLHGKMGVKRVGEWLVVRLCVCRCVRFGWRFVCRSVFTWIYPLRCVCIRVLGGLTK
jgi:hypothetical protein